MRNATNSIVAVCMTALALGGCGQSNQGEQNILVDSNVPADAEIEALPADESASTPTNELMGGNEGTTAEQGNNTGN